MAESNGIPILAGAPAAMESLSPIIGARKCRITRPLDAPPDHKGQWGRAWKTDLEAARKKQPFGAPPDATVAHWIVEAPWSSEVVHSYSIMLVHLRFDFVHEPVIRYLEGATHEIALIAINPQADRAPLLNSPIGSGAWLAPAVFAAQIIAPSDEVAAARAARAVELICSGRLSPHPTHVKSWAELFGANILSKAGAPTLVPGTGSEN